MQNTQTLTITNGGSFTNEALLTKNGLFPAVLIPATFTGTGLAVYGSMDGTNFYPVLSELGTSVELVCTASTAAILKLPQNLVFGLPFMKLRATTSQAGGDKTLISTFMDFV